MDADYGKGIRKKLMINEAFLKTPKSTSGCFYVGLLSASIGLYRRLIGLETAFRFFGFPK
jgi:hypothetical protein